MMMNKSIKTNTQYLLLISLVSAMGGLLFGYDWVVIGGAKIFYEPFFNLEVSAAMRGWAMSSALVGCLVGAMLSGKWSDRYGRRLMLIIASILFILSAIGTGATSNFSYFIIFRIIGGLGIGIASNVSPIYISEVSPANVRGRLVSLNQLAIVIGILAAQLANWQIGEYFTNPNHYIGGMANQSAWRWMFWSELIPAGLFFLLSFIIPESPRWLTVNKQTQKARKVFTKIGGIQYAESAISEIEHLNNQANQQITNSWKILQNSKVRRILIIGIILAVFQQWCGINVIFNYAQEIFSAAGYGVSDILMNIVITGVTNLVFTFLAIYTVDKWGRRALLFVGSLGLGIIYLIMGLGYFFQIGGIFMLFLVVLAIACYAMSLAPVVWVVLSEIFPAKIRGLAMSVATSFLWIACFLLTYTFPILNTYLGSAGTFWIYGGICFAGFLFIKNYLPETKGKSLEEIEKELTK